MGTNLDGLGEMGFGTLPKRKPGKLQVVARHPCISEAKKTVEWSDVLHERRPLKSFSKPMFILKAEGGPGLAAWRDSVAKKAPTLVKSLLEAKDKKDIDVITQKLTAGEMMSIPPLVVALQDYENPQRSRLVRACIWAWNGCGGQGPLDPTIRIKALAIYRVQMHASIVAAKPQAKPTFLRKIPDEGVLLVAREVAWVIKDLEAKLVAARRADDPGSVGTEEMVLSKMKEVEKQIKELREDGRN